MFIEIMEKRSEHVLTSIWIRIETKICDKQKTVREPTLIERAFGKIFRYHLK